MTEHPIDIAAAIGIGLALLILGAALFKPKTTSSLPVVLETTAVSLKLSAKELRQLCREHQINNAKWRNRAIKTDMVRALHANGVTHV